MVASIYIKTNLDGLVIVDFSGHRVGWQIRHLTSSNVFLILQPDETGRELIVSICTLD